VRKRLENYAKYRKMDATNYMRYVTDLIGIRGLLLYREDWVNFHKYITHWFKNDPEKYIRDYGRDYDKNARRAIWQSRRKSIQDLAITPTSI
ncbi:MAG: GTP pyrophosphokinase, partial [Clostridia bacterium]